MKKIKLLLGIGLLVALFSTCFGTHITAFEYYYNNGQTSYSFDGLGRNLRPIMNINNGINTGLILNYRNGYDSTNTGVLLLSSYLHSGYSNSLLSTVNYDYFHIYFNADLNFIGLIQNRTNTTSTTHKSFYYKFTTGDYDSSVTAGFIVSSNISSFIRVNSDFENCLQNGRFNGDCIASRFFIHTINSTYDSFAKSIINDSLDKGISYNKGPVVSVIGDSYSFFMSNGLGTGSSDLNSSTFIPRIRVPATSTTSGYTLNNVFAMKLNNYSEISSNLSNYQILVLQVTGVDIQIYDFVYSIYDCPGDAYFLSSCTFNQGGFLRPSTSTYHFQSSGDSLIVLDNTGRDNLLFLLSYPFDYSFTPNYSPTLYNSYDSLTNTLTIYRPLVSSVSDFNAKMRGYSLTLQPSDGIDIFSGVNLSPGNGIQPSYSGTVSLNNCIDTQICWDYTGSQGDILRMCTTQCVSSGVIASGGYIGSDGTYYFVNSPISIEDSLKTDNPENMFTGSYIDSGGILSLSYFTDYFQPGAKKIGVCPFKYYEGPLDFMTKLKIGDVYLLMPVLCFYSAFQQGKNVSFFDQYDVNDGLFSQPLLYGESDNHKLLFAFFDVLFSIGLLGLIRYLSRHLF